MILAGNAEVYLCWHKTHFARNRGRNGTTAAIGLKICLGFPNHAGQSRHPRSKNNENFTDQLNDGFQRKIMPAEVASATAITRRNSFQATGVFKR